VHHSAYIKAIEEKGWKYFKQGQYDQSIKIWNELFHEEAHNIAAFQGNIACLRKKHNFTGAKQLLDKALVLHPSHLGILCEGAWLNVDQNQYDAAIGSFDAILKIDHNNEDILVWKIFLLRDKRRFIEARSLINEASDLFPGSLKIRCELGWLHFYERKYPQAIEQFEAILKIDALNESAIQGKIATLRSLGRFAEGIQLAESALCQIKNSPGIFGELGWINFQQEHYEKAQQNFRKVLDLNPEDPYSYINLAWALVRQETEPALDGAAILCREALGKNPYMAGAFGCLGNISFKKGQIRDAVSFFIRSIEVDSQKGHYADLGTLYSQMGQYEEAKERLDQAVKNNPDDAYAHIELGNLYVLTDKVKEAIREFRLAAIIDPQNPAVFNGLAIALMENAQLIEAEKVLRKALRTLDRARRWELHLTLCRLLSAIGDDTGDVHFQEEALKEVNSAIQQKPDHPSPYFHSGIVHFKLEDYSNSLKSFKNCLKEDEFHLEAASNARRVRNMIRKDKDRSRSSRLASLFLVALFLAQLIFIWVFRIYYLNKISETLIGILVPILLGLIVVAALLPWLNRLKMSGLEAELNQPNPKETLSKGPKGEIGFSKHAGI
jgi:tetratricopeptide (TPR) repeat protein